MLSPLLKDSLLTKCKKHNKIILQLHVIIPRLDNENKNQAVGMFLSGSSRNAIVRRFRCHLFAITRTVGGYNRRSRGVLDGPRPDRTCVTTQWEEVQLMVMHFRFRFIAANISARRTISILGQVIYTKYKANYFPRFYGFFLDFRSLFRHSVHPNTVRSCRLKGERGLY